MDSGSAGSLQPGAPPFRGYVEAISADNMDPTAFALHSRFQNDHASNMMKAYGVFSDFMWF